MVKSREPKPKNPETQGEVFSRRKLLLGAAAIAVSIGVSEVAKDLRFSPPTLDIQPRLAGRIAGIGSERLFPRDDFEGERREIITITDKDHLIYEPDGEFFTEGREFNYNHRTNNPDFLLETYRAGANLFDIDINNHNGTLYPEHGIIVQIGFKGLQLAAFRIDVNEKRFSRGLPSQTYEEIVAFVSSLSTDENPLAISAELKRGEVTPGKIIEIFAVHRKYGVPVIIHSPRKGELREMSGEIASLHIAQVESMEAA